MAPSASRRFQYINKTSPHEVTSWTVWPCIVTPQALCAMGGNPQSSKRPSVIMGHADWLPRFWNKTVAHIYLSNALRAGRNMWWEHRRICNHQALRDRNSLVVRCKEASSLSQPCGVTCKKMTKHFCVGLSGIEWAREPSSCIGCFHGQEQITSWILLTLVIWRQKPWDGLCNILLQLVGCEAGDTVGT